ncbi:hypothetical protein QR680_002798 [Steinernema hermaphroditum]|uniref:Pseudouridine synthase I TruA alpha/beta domain-containing protein n=1 Tax=Steinernema hermaphroditum TaxID=289476 RepID=A0AA39H517_9BILA|nr:hypothetical protein QR680_002798 [Steinernema hermaphroditum]
MPVDGRRFLLWMRYDGSMFPEMAKGGSKYGVMDLLNSVLSLTFPQGVKMAPSSRTDAGVHALRNTALVHIPLENRTLLDTREKQKNHLKQWNELIKQCNTGLELMDVHAVAPGFCARRNVSYRRYVYRLAVARSDEIWAKIADVPQPPCFSERHYAWRLPPGFDYKAAQQAADLFIGCNNLASFFKHPERARRKETEYPTTLRSIPYINVGPGAAYSMENDIYDYFYVTIVSRSFLREQIRRMMSVIVQAAYGRIDMSTIKWLIDNPKPWNFFDRKIKVAPPNGLFLADIAYDSLYTMNDPRYEFPGVPTLVLFDEHGPISEYCIYPDKAPKSPLRSLNQDFDNNAVRVGNVVVEQQEFLEAVTREPEPEIIAADIAIHDEFEEQEAAVEAVNQPEFAQLTPIKVQDRPEPEKSGAKEEAGHVSTEPCVQTDGTENTGEEDIRVDDQPEPLVQEGQCPLPPKNEPTARPEEISADIASTESALTKLKLDEKTEPENPGQVSKPTNASSVLAQKSPKRIQKAEMNQRRPTGKEPTPGLFARLSQPKTAQQTTQRPVQTSRVRGVSPKPASLTARPRPAPSTTLNNGPKPSSVTKPIEARAPRRAPSPVPVASRPKVAAPPSKPVPLPARARGTSPQPVAKPAVSSAKAPRSSLFDRLSQPKTASTGSTNAAAPKPRVLPQSGSIYDRLSKPKAQPAPTASTHSKSEASRRAIMVSTEQAIKSAVDNYGMNPSYKDLRSARIPGLVGFKGAPVKRVHSVERKEKDAKPSER